MNTEKEIFNSLIKMGWTPPEKPKLYELSAYGWCINTNSYIEQGTTFIKYTKAGATRKTKKSAKLALDRMLRMMRLSALAAELSGEKKFVGGKENFYIYLLNGKYVVSSDTVVFSPERVYMTKECAIKICRMLNKGEFKL